MPYVFGPRRSFNNQKCVMTNCQNISDGMPFETHCNPKEMKTAFGAIIYGWTIVGFFVIVMLINIAGYVILSYR